MIRPVALLACLALPVLSSPAAADAIRIGTESGYPPYMSLDAAGRLQGYDKDLGDLICTMIEADCTWTDAAFDSLLPDLAAGQYDLVIAALAASPERQLTVDFSAPYMTGGENIGVFAGLNPGQPLDTARIGVQAGTIHAQHLIDTGRNVTLFPSNDAALDALMRREVDLVFTSDLVLRDAFERRYPALRRVAEEAVQAWDTAVAVRKGAGTLLDRVNLAIETLRVNGMLDQLEDKWFVDGQTL